MDYRWGPAKARRNLHKHGVDFADAVTALEDERALTQLDPHSVLEERFVSMGTDANQRLLVTVFAMRAGNVRIISARPATKAERRTYEGK